MEICADHGDDSKNKDKNTIQYSWYGRGATIKSLWNAAIHAHQFYLDQKSLRKAKNAKFQRQMDELERKLDKQNLINVEIVDTPLQSQAGARLVLTKKPEENPERRAREFEAMIGKIYNNFTTALWVWNFVFRKLKKND